MGQTGPEMLLNTLIKLFKLEGHVETLKQQVKRAADENYIDKAKVAFERIESFDARLERIERALNTKPVEPGADSGSGKLALGHDRDNTVQFEQRHTG